MKLGGKFRFPVAEGILKQPEAKQVVRNSTIKDPSTKVDEGQPLVEEEAERPPSPPNVEYEPDSWYMVGDALVRKHVNPRKELFVLDPLDCPIPLKYLDVYRYTNTDLNSFSESSITDFRTDGPIELSDTWVGTIKFHILRPDP